MNETEALPAGGAVAEALLLMDQINVQDIDDAIEQYEQGLIRLRAIKAALTRESKPSRKQAKNKKAAVAE